MGISKDQDFENFELAPMLNSRSRRSRSSNILSTQIVLVFLPPSILTFVLGNQKNRLIKTVLLSTNYMCFGWEIKNKYINYWYTALS